MNLLFPAPSGRLFILQLLTILLLGIPSGRAGSLSAEIVAQTERAFSSRCAEIGIRDSFLEYFAADAIHFERGPRLAHPDLERETSSVMPRLTWEPKIIRVASSGQLAISTGPYILRSKSGKESFGDFLSIWKKQSGGEWKVGVDIGFPAPRPLTLQQIFRRTMTCPLPNRLIVRQSWPLSGHNSIETPI